MAEAQFKIPAKIVAKIVQKVNPRGRNGGACKANALNF
jgi:hypothetical protein